MDTLSTIIVTAVISSFTAFLFTEFVSWKVSARQERLMEFKKLLEELYSPIITILNWMSIRTRNQIESDDISENVPMQKNVDCFFVLHPHQYDKLWKVRSKYMYLFIDEEDLNLRKIDDIFLNLKLFKNSSGTKERWIFKVKSEKDANKLKEELIEKLNSKIMEISEEINRLEKILNNVCRRILFLLTFWKI